MRPRIRRAVPRRDPRGEDRPQILDCSAADGRMSYTDLGKATGLSTSAVHQRVKRLEERGLITGLRRHDRPCRSRHAADGVHLHHARSTPRSPTTRPSGSRTSPRSSRCWSVAGEESYILKVRVATPGDLEDLLARIRAAANVSTRTTIVLSTPWEGRSASAATREVS